MDGNILFYIHCALNLRILAASPPLPGFGTLQVSLLQGKARCGVAGELRSGRHDTMSQHPVWLTRLAMGGAALLILGVTTYDSHRSIEANQAPPTKEQVAALAAQIEESRYSSDSPSKGVA